MTELVDGNTIPILLFFLMCYKLTKGIKTQFAHSGQNIHSSLFYLAFFPLVQNGNAVSVLKVCSINL